MNTTYNSGQNPYTTTTSISSFNLLGSALNYTTTTKDNYDFNTYRYTNITYDSTGQVAGYTRIATSAIDGTVTTVTRSNIVLDTYGRQVTWTENGTVTNGSVTYATATTTRTANSTSNAKKGKTPPTAVRRSNR